MRELTAMEINQVSGGSLSLSDTAGTGGALGSIFGATVTGTINGAIRGGAAGALVGATFALSYNVCSGIVNLAT